MAETFTPVELSKPINELTQIEALVLVNRWLKMKSYFFYADSDELYALKGRKIAEFVRNGSLRMVKVIRRETEAIIGMRNQIENGGKDLGWLDLISSAYHAAIENHPGYDHYRVLVDLVNGGLEVPVDETIYQLQKDEYDHLFAEYSKEKQQYDELYKEWNAEHKIYLQASANYEKEVFCQFLVYIDALEIKSAEDKQVASFLRKHQNLSKKQRGRVRKLITQYKFEIAQPRPSKPIQQPKAPKLPKAPDKIVYVGVDEYVAGSDKSVEDAFQWLKSYAEERLSLPECITELDDFFICCELENELAEDSLDEMRTEALKIFESVLNGSLSDPYKIWDKLTELELDYYDALGMTSYTNYRYHQTRQKDFSKWHEINFSRTGFWLVEFQSAENEAITFHMPYDQAVKIFSESMLSNLPTDETDQIGYGREITVNEQRDYPISDLVKILGMTEDDFPHGLRNYNKANYGYKADRYYDDDQDWITEFDEDDWAEVGY